MALLFRSPRAALSRTFFPAPLRQSLILRPILLSPLTVLTNTPTSTPHSTPAIRTISTDSFTEGPIFKAQLDNVMAGKNPYTTITDAITSDHQELKTYYREICTALDRQDHDAATRWQNQFVWELARHSVAEELIVYPAFEAILGEKGKEMANKDRAEHHELKLALQTFQSTRSTSPSFHQHLNSLHTSLTSHIHSEEHHDLPLLEHALRNHPANTPGSHDRGTGHPIMDSASLARSFERTKWFVPTRSHPEAGEMPLFESAMGLLAAPIDRVRDLFARFPK